MNSRGFTLIEVVMIIVLLGIIMPGVLLYFIQGVKDSAAAQRRTTAIFLAEGVMEEIKSKNWDEMTTIAADCINASAIGPDAGEAQRGKYDDIDDFNGISNTPPEDSQGTAMTSYAGFTQQATVSYVAAADLNTPVGGPTCYKRISVSIKDAGSDETIELVTLMTSY